MRKTTSPEALRKQEAQRLARLWETADLLLQKVEEAAGQLHIQVAKKTEKEKQVEYDPNTPGKVAKEMLIERESFEELPGIIDRQGLRQLSAVLKDIKEVKMPKTELEFREQETKLQLLQRQLSGEETGKLEVVLAAGPEDWNG